MANNKTIIIIAGPTAVGKTGAAIQVAKHFNTEIISADSRQCFKEMNIGVARPSEKELKEVKHHFIASHSIIENINAVKFENYALLKADEIFLENDFAVMVGGTGLYIKAFCEGLDEMPEIPMELRNEIVENYNKYGIAWLQQQVKEIDPEFYKNGEVQNPHRLMRALEIKKATGVSITSFRKGEKKKRDFNIRKFALQLPKEQLHNNINNRVDAMIKEGLVKEVENLLSYKNLPALQTVGYKELFNFFNNEMSLETAVELIKKNTRHYAKRQMTWFKKDADFDWIHPNEVNKIINKISTNYQRD